MVVHYVLDCTKIFERFVFILHWIHVETRMNFFTISKRSCHIQHCTYIQCIAILLYVQYTIISSFLSTLYCTVSKSILHWKSVYSVRLHCTEWALKHGYILYCTWEHWRYNIVCNVRPLRLRLYENLRKVCFSLHWMRVETRVNFLMISMRSCHFQHCT